MPEAAQAIKFLVYVVESPSAPDIYHGRSEGDLISRALSLNAIPCVTRTAIMPVAFSAALKVGFPEVMGAHPGRLPILHLSAHGGKSGIQLSNGELVPWTALRDLILPINTSLGGALLLCMSACEGYSACQMAMQVDDAPHPYFAIVANFGSPTWSDTAVAYSAFYHRLSKGATVVESVEAMRIASGDARWVSETAEEARQSYVEYVRSNVDLPGAQRDLQSQAQGQEVSPDAKALEGSAG
jgi:hypothetical protein